MKFTLSPDMMNIIISDSDLVDGGITGETSGRCVPESGNYCIFFGSHCSNLGANMLSSFLVSIIPMTKHRSELLFCLN